MRSLIYIIRARRGNRSCARSIVVVVLAGWATRRALYAPRTQMDDSAAHGDRARIIIAEGGGGGRAC